ncbi:Hypothetical protein NTJ_14733 [Nesidiocoris tenuis]|uniref:Uncharacterized protein n=1 Tax=Nesidiocoris tenuis TaxID=355587 RepID=A0ABN7BDI8_9HEMI|nr:Hypothetical protein NTJ_14733 [Nesidiocoris tenuis]
MMSIAPSLLLAFFSVQILSSLGSTAEERRSDVRAVLGEMPDPGFWPTRGRRSGGGAPLIPVDLSTPPSYFWLQHYRQLFTNPLCGEVPVIQRSFNPELRFVQKS